ncbi:MAG: CBS domain-containing protein [Methanotrichaceae archaeon]
MLVREIMSKDPLYVAEDDFVTKARQLIRDNHLRGLPVLNRERYVVGIVSIQGVLKIVSTRSNVTVAGFVEKGPLATEDTDIAEAAKLLLTEKYAILPVVQSLEIRKLGGVVSPVDIFKKINLEKVPEKAIRKLMNTKVITCSPEDIVTKVWDSMLESNITGLPVMDEKGKPVGMITRFDILKRGGARIGKKERVRSKDVMKVKKLMRTPLYHVESKTSLRDAVDLMLRREIGRISVVDDGKLVGIVDRYDMIKAIFKVG